MFKNAFYLLFSASLAALGASVGCLIAQSMINSFGLRGTVLLSHVICLLGWVLTISSLTTINFLTGRLLTGIFVGLVSVSVGEYCAECFPTRPSSRPIVFMSLGVLFVYLASSLLNYSQTALIAILATISSFVLIRVFMPESPAWLESRGRIGDAEYSKLKLRLATSTTETEVSPAKGLNFLRHFNNVDVHRPFLALCLHFALQQLSGPLVLITFASQFLNDSGVWGLNSYFISVVLAIFLVAGSLVCAAMRHPESTATLSSAGLLAASLIITIYNFFRSLFLNRLASRVFGFVPLLGMAVFMTFSCTALVPNVPIKNVPGEHVAMAFSYAFAFLVIQFYPYIHSQLSWWVFVFFAIPAALNIIFGVLAFTEPKSKHPNKESSAEPAV